MTFFKEVLLARLFYFPSCHFPLKTPDLLLDVLQDILEPLVEGDVTLVVVINLGELSNPVHHTVLKQESEKLVNESWI